MYHDNIQSALEDLNRAAQSGTCVRHDSAATIYPRSARSKLTGLLWNIRSTSTQRAGCKITCTVRN